MADDIFNFPLRGAPDAQLAAALGKSFFEYQTWHNQAASIEQFVEDAQATGLGPQQERRIQRLWNWASENGMSFTDPATNAEMVRQATAKYVADQEIASTVGTKISRIVMLHSACETFYWRLSRFWLVTNRADAITRHEKKNVTVGDLAKLGSDAVIDSVLENWWDGHGRQGSLLYKFDVIVGMYGMPPDTKTGQWDFTKDMLTTFDEARHDAVHHQAGLLNQFDLSGFANQLHRFNLALNFHVHRVTGIPFDRLAFFGLELDPNSPLAKANGPVQLSPFKPFNDVVV